MAQVDITINNRPYRIACDDGQEDHLRRLAEYVDSRVQELVAAIGQAGEARLLVMASLLIADELSEAVASLGEDDAGGSPEAALEARAEATENLAERIERIAARLEPA